MKNVKRIFSPEAVKHTFRKVSLRYPLPLIFATLLTLWEIYWLFEWNDKFDVLFRTVSWALSEGFLLTLAVNLWCEFSGNKHRLKLAQLIAVALVAADFIVLQFRGGFGGNAEMIGRSALVVAMITAIFFLPAVRLYNRKQLWFYTLTQIGAAASAACLGAVMAISCLIIFSTVDILFGISNHKYMMAASCVFGAFIPCVVYLSNIPRLRDITKAILPDRTLAGAFCKNVVLPIVAVYTIILYVYAAKTLFTWNLPNVSVTWMVTGLMITVLVMLYGLQRYGFGGNFSESAVRISSLARKWIPVLLLPLLVMMTVGLVYRIREYGITVSRLYVAAFNIWAYAIVIYMAVKQNANLNVVAASFSLVFVLVSIFPGANFTYISTRILQSQVTEALRSAGVESLPISVGQAKEVLGRMDKQTAQSTASKIEYLDSWSDHSDIAGIISSKDRILDYNLLPEKYQDDEAMIPATFICELDKTEPVDIPAGYSKILFNRDYNTDITMSGDGVADLKIEGYETLHINIDDVADNKALACPTVSEKGDSAIIAFTDLRITGKEKHDRKYSSYYIFTK